MDNEKASAVCNIGTIRGLRTSFLATVLQDRIQDKTSTYEVKTLSVSKTPVKSIGGFTVFPDYSVEDCPTDYAGLVLIGGNSWRTEEAVSS